MFSAYFVRPPVCRGGAGYNHFTHLHATKLRPILLGATATRRSCLQRQASLRSRRYLHNTRCLLEAERPPIASGDINFGLGISAFDEDEDSFEHNAGFYPPKPQASAQPGRKPVQLLSPELNRKLFQAVLPRSVRSGSKCPGDTLLRTSSNDGVSQHEQKPSSSNDGSEVHGAVDIVRGAPNQLFRTDHGLRYPAAALAVRASSDTRGLQELSLYKHASREESQAMDAKISSLLAGTPYTLEDARGWSDILTSDDTLCAVRRYVELVEENHRRGRPPMPLFVTLQLLAAPSIPAKELRKLLKSIQEYAVMREWDASSVMLLMVRGIRHSRVVAPETLEVYAHLVRDLMLTQAGIATSFVAECCNKILQLIAVPTRPYPYRNMLLQQAAQVRLVRYMVEHQPELPVTRVGFRALINVQLVHRKTQPEVDWARAKSLSWPPWREDMLGIDASLTYPGQESRALKLLNRMNEAGYEHLAWEQAAKILAGWDTDGSPTIQTRRSLRMLLFKQGVTGTEAEDGEELIWAARITATRTVREAWAAFLTYRKQAVAGSKKMACEPFEAMFAKLFANPQVLVKGSTVMPGDSKETWRDPTSDIDVIYVDKEPPSVQELYAQMRKDKVKPNRGLLSTLLANTDDIDVGVSYIQEHLSEEHRQCFLHAHDCQPETIRSTFQMVWPPLLSAFIFHLFSAKKDAKFSYKGKSARGVAANISPRQYGLELLRLGEIPERTVYVGALEGLLAHLSFTPEEARDGFAIKSYIRQAIMMCRSLLQVMEDSQVDHDFRTLRATLLVYQQVLKQGFWPRWLSVSDLLEFVKNTFAHCVQSHSGSQEWLATATPIPLEAIPDPHDLRVLVETLGMLGDSHALEELVRWISTNMTDFQRRHQHVRTADEQMRRVMIVSRIFIEGWLVSGEAKKGSFDTITDGMSAGLYIPTAADCAEYLDANRNWVRRHLQYTRFSPSWAKGEYDMVKVEGLKHVEMEQPPDAVRPDQTSVQIL